MLRKSRTKPEADAEPTVYAASTGVTDEDIDRAREIVVESRARREPVPVVPLASTSSKTRTYLVNKQNVTASAASEAEMIDALRVACVARFGECKPGSGRLVHEGDHRYSWRR